MTDQTDTKPVTLTHLLAIPERIEIISGKIVELPASGAAHQLIGGNIYDVLNIHVDKGTGAVFFHGLAYLMNSPTQALDNVFVPDVSFFRLETVPSAWNFNLPHPGVPDLAIEIVSPCDDPDDLQTKRKTYLAKGTEQVWIIYPQTREVHQFRRDNNPEIRIYKEGETLDCESLLPGLLLTTDMIFNLPAWAIR
jgi:Uma2 family endonuclease